MANVFDLSAIIRLDDSPFREGLSNVGRVIKGFTVATGAALGAAATGVATLVKSTIDAYGEYEQLAGGVRKLYGNMGLSLEEYAEQQNQAVDDIRAKWEELEEAQRMVLENANAAYRTSGMSMNSYMETATQFSASLISALGGDSVEAARLTDVAMVAISDNWNTFGGDLEAISNAFKGFSKQNYNMLDNLKLGYGGSRKEMERLIADANEYAESIGEASDLSITSFADIITAIDLIQQKQQIAGTTAREATTTIQGSLNMTKAAWENLLTAFGDKDADLSVYFDALQESATIALENLVPVAEQALSSIGKIVSNLGPIIAEALPKLIEDLVPELLSTAASLVDALVAALPGILSSLWDSIYRLISEVGGENLASSVSNLLDSLKGVFNDLSDLMPDMDFTLQDVFDGAADVINEVANAINWLRNAIKNLPDAISEFVTSAENKVNGVLDSVAGFFSGIWSAILSEMQPMIDGIVYAFQSAWDLIRTIWNLDFVQQAWGNIQDAALLAWDVIRAAWEIAQSFFVNLWDVIKTAGSVVWTTISGVAQVAWEAIKASWEAAKGFFSVIFNTIGGLFSALASALQGDFQGAWDAIKAVADGWADYFQGLWDGIVAIFSTARDVGSDIVNGLLEGVQSAWASFKGWIVDAWESIKSIFTVDVDMPSGHSGGTRHATGLDYVPYNDYPALLHKGEAVLTAQEADAWRQGESGSGKVVNLNIYAQQLTQADMDYIVATVNRELAP